jgi:hypothetical protein
MLFSVALFVATFFSRWWPRLICKESGVDYDTYFHLLHAESIRQNNFRLPPRVDKYVVNGAYIYPPAYHYLLALFPRKKREILETMTSAIFDAVVVVIFYVVSSNYLDSLGLETYSLLLLSLVFSFCPAMVGVGTGPRAYQGTPRTMGEMLASMGFLSLWQFYITHQWPWLLLAILTNSIMLNTSKFAAQALLFISFVMGIILNQTLFIALPLLSWILAIIISKGNYWLIFRGQLEHLYVYATKLVSEYGTSTSRLKMVLPKSIKEAVNILFFQHPVGILLTRFTISMLAIFFLIYGYFSKSTIENDSFLVAWLIASFVVFIVTSTRNFLFIGESDRYLEYSLIPAFVLFGQNVSKSILIIALVIHIVLYLLHVLSFIRSKLKDTNARYELLQNLKGIRSSVVLAITAVELMPIAYFTDHRICDSESYSERYQSKEEFNKLFRKYPFPSTDFKYYASQYGVELIVAVKSFVNVASQEGYLYDFDGLTLLFENEQYLLFRVPSAWSNTDEVAECVA